jgi:hypothetical protein
MSQLQELQFPIDQAIFAEVLKALPKGWTRARLEAKASEIGPTSTRISVRIDGLGQPGVAVVSDELQDRVRELFSLNERFKTDLVGIDYSYSLDPDGRWDFSGDYDYSS